MMGWMAGRMPGRLSYGQKLALLAAVPLMVAAAAIVLGVALQARGYAHREVRLIERELIDAKRAELRHYVHLARTAIGPVYGNAGPDDGDAKTRVLQTLAAMLYGDDGYFFVFDYDGTALAAPRRTELIGRDWSDLRDADGTPVTAELIRIARTGGGYHEFLWTRPSTGETLPALAYVTGLQDWRWAIGTGVFLEDVEEAVGTFRADSAARLRGTVAIVGGILLAALALVFGTGLFLNAREQRLADARLKELAKRVVAGQEEERGRVARELHDGISQILVGARFALDVARRRTESGDARAADSMRRATEQIAHAIQEVRRISRDLRPGTLDDLGLGPAIAQLADAFRDRTGIATEFETVVFRGRLDEAARIALFRIAQEALTNIERHAGASRVCITLRGHRRGATLKITDDGCGISGEGAGMGMRNMQERLDQLGGTLHVATGPKGTTVAATVPLDHILSPASDNERRAAS